MAKTTTRSRGRTTTSSSVRKVTTTSSTTTTTTSSCCNSNHKDDDGRFGSSVRRPRVIVIGAGMSGLACGRELVHRNHDVLVVEARSAPGGRCRAEPLETGTSTSMDTTTTTTTMVDVGGALIHGITDNPIYQLAVEQLGCTAIPLRDCTLVDGSTCRNKIREKCDGGGRYMHPSNTTIDANVDDDVSRLFNECLEETFAQIPNQPSLMSSFGTLFDRIVQRKKQQQQQQQDGRGGSSSSSSNKNNTTTPKSTPTRRQEELLLQWHRANLELSCGATLDRLGYGWNDDEVYEFTGPHVAIHEGWTSVTGALASSLNVLYDTPVRTIRIVSTTETDDDATTTTSTTTTTTRRKQQTHNDGHHHHDVTGSRSTSGPTRTTTARAIASAPRSSLRPTLSTTPTRRSRRLRGEDVNVRRSLRANKGVLTRAHFTISNNSNASSYDNDGYDNDGRTAIRRTTTTTTTIPRKTTTAAATNHNKNSTHRNSSSGSSIQTGKNTNTKVHVVLEADGTVLEADAVVCTLPLGILKVAPRQPGHVQFDPPLPSDKRTAIDELGCGLLNKCVLTFPSVFWQKNDADDDDDDAATVADFVGIVDDPPHIILNAHVVTGRAILVFLFGGDMARHVETKKDVEIVEMCMNVLRKTFAASTSSSATTRNETTTTRTTAKYKGDDDSIDIPEPIDYVVTRWGKDVYARGAFVYIPPGVQGMKQLEVMSEPIVDKDGRPLILFAGEHTTPYHPSTIHGAFLSGIREAYRLDLNLFPDWNNNLAFDPNHLYKKTFPVRRNVPTTLGELKSENGSSLSTSSLQPAAPPPRRRRHGAMALRKRPRSANYAAVANGQLSTRPPAQNKTKKATQPSPLRRSNRIAGEEPIPTVSTSRSLTLKQQESDRRQRRRRQEDRTLVRAYQSFRDWQLIDEMVFPVYGGADDSSSSITDGSSKSRPSRLRTRYQQVKPKPPKPLDASILETWRPVPNKEDASRGSGTKRRVNGRRDHHSSERRKSQRIAG